MSSETSTPADCAPPCVTAIPEAPGASGDDFRWFATEVLPHESGLRGWLRKRFPWVTDVDDVVQDSLVRLFRAKQQQGTIDHARSYLFTTARNAVFDASRRQRRSPIDAVADLDQIPVLDNRVSVPDALCHDQDIEMLADAIKSLPKKRRVVLTLVKLRGLTYREVAIKLGISENTVCAHLTLALAQCREYLCERGVDQGPQP